MYKETKSSWEQYRKMEKKNFRNLWRVSNFDAWCRDCKRFIDELIGFSNDVRDIVGRANAQGQELCGNKEYQFVHGERHIPAALIVKRLIQEGLNSLIEIQPDENAKVPKKYIRETVDYLISVSMR